jgi:hypothetical protein
VVEVVIPDQAAEGLAAELAVLLLVELLEDGALVPGGTLEFLEGLVQLLLGDVHHPDLEHLVRFGVVHQVMQSTPGPFELLEVRVVQDLVDLLAELPVDLGDHGLDGADRVVRDQGGLLQRLGRPGWRRRTLRPHGRDRSWA